jgi:hypothetical protein
MFLFLSYSYPYELDRSLFINDIPEHGYLKFLGAYTILTSEVFRSLFYGTPIILQEPTP